MWGRGAAHSVCAARDERSCGCAVPSTQPLATVTGVGRYARSASALQCDRVEKEGYAAVWAGNSEAAIGSVRQAPKS